MNKTLSQEKIYVILDLVAESPNLSQRELANSTGFSLGLINLTIKRLIKTGHLKVSNWNQRKVEYILTPKGMMEKAKRSYLYLSSTMKTFLEYRHRLEKIFWKLGKEGRRRFAILGEGEIVTLVEMSLLQSIPQAVFRRVVTEGALLPGETLLDCRLHGETEFGISVMSQLLAPESFQSRAENSPYRQREKIS